MDNILELNGLSENLLQALSYKTMLGISLKKNLHYFNKKELLEELYEYASWLECTSLTDELDLDFRIKSEKSINQKFDRYYPDHQVRKVFNDILGMRTFCDDYRSVIGLHSECFHIADMSNGKSNDDGYRGVHLYYQINNSFYPIEIQFNTLYDRQLNNWLHDYLYKKDYPNSIGAILRNKYENGLINNIEDFKEVLNGTLSNCKR